MNTSTLYKLKFSRDFNRTFAKLRQKDKDLVETTLGLLALGKKLPASYKNHRLKGKLKDRYDCHVRGDLVLVYEKNEKALILTAIKIGKHSNTLE